MKMSSPDQTFSSQVRTQIDVNYPSHVQAIEDIEQPAWTSSSFSESCGSCLSRISSLCLEKENEPQDSSDSRLDSSRSENITCNGVTLSECTAELVPYREEDDEANGNDPSALCGSLQSLSSSSKTIYASPRSNSEDLLHCTPNRFLEEKEMTIRQAKLYRERAPSENALDFTHLNLVKASKLSHSLHDVASIPSNGLKNPLHKSSNTRASMSALHLRNRSRDSGFIRADSLMSLSSGSRNYDHVESKVKQYIQSIKDADAVRKREKAQLKDTPSNVRKPVENQYTYHDGPELIHIVQAMKTDMEQKDKILQQKNEILQKLQQDYNTLLAKYADAEYKIDRLRFGSHENVPNCSHGNTTFMSQGQQPSSFIYRQPPETSVLGDTDNCSLNSSMMFSNLELADSCDSTSFQTKENFVERSKKEIVTSAPLRPISSLYCTSARLDKVIVPLTSKSSVSAFSMSSSGKPSDGPLNVKMKKDADLELPDLTIKEGTTDTGIGSCCPLSGEGFSTTRLPLKSGPIGHLPHEDPMLKVQRWQKSLQVSCYTDSQYPCQSTSKQRKQVLKTDKCVTDKFLPDTSKREVHSVGIQVNETSEFPSFTSELTIPIVPCLNLGELSSGCTDEFRGTVPINEQQSLKSITGSNSISQNSGFVGEPLLNPVPSKIPETSTPAKHLCQGLCRVCGCRIIQDKKYFRGYAQSGVRKVNGRQLSDRSGIKAVAQSSSSEPAHLSCLINQDQDHVVPASPEDEQSCQLALRILKRRLGSLEKSENFQAIVSVLDILLGKVLLDKSSVHNFPVKTDATVQASSRPEPLQDCSDVDGSLLQCLEELDEYTHQVWAKTESFLEVLNSKELPLSGKP